MRSKPWVGSSEVHRRIVDTLRRLAPTDLEIMLSGPSGVGKERYAQYAHSLSERSGKFVAVNCGAIPSELVENELFGHVNGAFTGARTEFAGLVSEAEGGTLFLDEVDALSPRNQVVLLRFLQEKEYRRLGETKVRRADVRVIAASNADLQQAMQEQRFRRDLLFRLRVAPVEIPALSARPEDVVAILEEYRVYYAAEYAVTPIALSSCAEAELRNYEWPGNVREVENCIRYLTCLQLGRPIEPTDLPFLAAKPTAANGYQMTNDKHARNAKGTGVDFRAAKAAVVGELERSLIEQALAQCNGNITHAARSIGKPRRTFFELMRKHKISAGNR